jgi:hypothetical protein
MSEGNRIGEIMSKSGYVTTEQVNAALMIQATLGENRLIGQIPVSRGYCTTVQVQVALTRQKKNTEIPSE